MNKLFFVFLILIANPCFAKKQSITMFVNETKELNIGFIPKEMVLGSNKIANVIILDNNIVNIISKSEGRTNVLFYDNKNKLDLSIYVKNKASEVVSLNKSLYVAGFKKVKVIQVSDSIFLNGIIKDLDSKKRMLSMVNKMIGLSYIDNVIVSNSRQIRISLTLAEVSKSVKESLGVDFSAISWSKIDGVIGKSLSATLSALSENDLANVLTNPSLIVSNNSTGSFEAGGEVPVLEYDMDSGEVSVSFKEYGIKLEFKPVINTDRTIDLRIKVSSSEISGFIDMRGTKTPMLNTRKVSTQLNVNNGDTFVLAGLINNNQSQSVKKIPGLGDIPILGALFTSQNFVSNKSELMIFAKIDLVNNNIKNISLPYIKIKSPMSIFLNIDSMDKNLDSDVYEIIKGATYHYEN